MRDRTFAFTKMHGLGNCYIYLDGISRELDIPSPADLSIRVSDPYKGIGSDGLILILPSNQADVRMRIFNKDGSEAKNCGNGLRCVAKYAYEHGLVNRKHFTIETLSGNKEAEVHLRFGHADEVTIDMGEPILERGRIPLQGGDPGSKVIREPLTVDGVDYRFTAVSMGNPHALFFVEDVDRAPIRRLGSLLADTYPLFPAGVNVGFVHPRSDHEADYRVWERGSGITQACGTGACASVVASVLESRMAGDRPVTVHLAGGDLTIEWQSRSNHVFMTGDAETICEGTLFVHDANKERSSTV
ncbi:MULTISPECIES: diaminopimelate epimerase [unclassified Sporolactobacillus]|uniref:diaminopimelate epimerase n=1 Tax=unclassified Sporolactobacillus TaxID=2628533 RepID=UPI002368C615|nr:diaminopimelate epimerase [Sporolactobacillus sp. CQH2019]MDD9147383.1 diaminopimelate epimerase [Sporolactobacillus sp. CQH2019]